MYQKMIKQVKEFYIAFKQEEHLKDYGITPERMVLRNKLWDEEVKELIEAIEKKDKVQIADAIMDMIYIRIGTLLERYAGDLQSVRNVMLLDDAESHCCTSYFFDYFDEDWMLFTELFNEVHRSNMSKLDENGEPIFRKDGKIIKSHLFREPELKSILEKYEVL